MLIIQLGTDENIKENIICDYMLFIAIELRKNSNFKTFWSYNAKKSGWTKKNSWSISSNRDQIYNGTIENYFCAKKKLLNFQKSYQGSDHMQ